jgi:hypothetical protein
LLIRNPPGELRATREKGKVPSAFRGLENGPEFRLLTGATPQMDVYYSIYGGMLVPTLQPPFLARRTADLSSRAVQERLSRSAIPAFFKLAHAWHLRDESTRQLLGGVSNGMFYQLKRGHKKILDQDKLTRISLLLGIFKALNILYSRKLADAWVNLPNSNPMFEGEAPLQYLIKGGVPALVRVRQLLDARRAGR